MKLVRLKAIALKEFLQIIRDPRSLALAVSIPILLLLLFGFALTLDVDRIPTVLYDLDHTPRSRDLPTVFLVPIFPTANWSRVTPISRKARHRPGVDGIGDSREFFPGPGGGPGYHHPGPHGRNRCEHRDHCSGYANAITLLYSQDLMKEKMTRLGVGKISPPIEPRIRIWFNPDLESKNFIVPG